MEAPTRNDLEKFCRETCFSMDLAGIVLAVIHKDMTMELIGGGGNPNMDKALPDLLRLLATSIEAGDVETAGDHGTVYPAP